MISIYQESTILITDPAWTELQWNNFFKATEEVSTVLNAVISQDKWLAVRREIFGNSPFDLGSDARHLAAQCTKDGHVLLPISWFLADHFTILECCGLFRLVGQHYQFSNSAENSPATVNQALTRLFDTEDDELTLHPEYIVTALRPDEVQEELVLA